MKSNSLTCLILMVFAIGLTGCFKNVETIKVRFVDDSCVSAGKTTTLPPVESILAVEDGANNRLANGLAYFHSGQYDDCRLFTEQHLSLNPADWRAHYLLALAEFASQDFRSAERCFQTALRFSPNDQKSRAVIYLASGQTLECLEKIAFAKQRYLMALNLDPDLIAAREGFDRLTTLSSVDD